MNKIFCFLLFFLSLNINSQTRGFDEKYFVGENVEFLKGKMLQVLEKEDYLQKYGYDDFYNTDDFNYKNAYKCQETNCFKTKYEYLANEKFTVLEYQKYEDILGASKYKLKLSDKNNTILFFDYDPKTYTRFPFKILNFEGFPDDFYCNQIIIENDKFDGSNKKYSPLLEDVSFMKTNGQIYLSLKTTGSTPVVNSKGVIILLSNKQKINKPNAKVNVEVNNRGKYEYSSFITLTKTDIDLLSKYDITDFKLYIFENQNNLYGEKYRRFLKCLK